MSDTRAVNGGSGLSALLFILFTGLKLGHVIDWSWWWVTSPLWITAGLAATFLVLSLVLLAVADK